MYNVVVGNFSFQVSTNMRYGDMQILKDTLESYGHNVKYTVPYIDDIGREIVFEYPPNHPMIQKSTVEIDDSPTQWIGYIEVGKNVYIVKDMHNMEVVKLLIRAREGDMLNIKGLGKLMVSSIYNHTEEEDGMKFKEVSLICQKAV